MGPKGSFTKIRADMDELMADVGRLEGRADTFGQVEERIVRVSEQAGELEQSQKLMARFFESVSEQVVQTEKEADRTIRELTTKVDELRSVGRGCDHGEGRGGGADGTGEWRYSTPRGSN